MKTIALIFLSIVFPIAVIAQSCLPEGIEFYHQTQIDNFQTNYPNCTEIEGDVNIHSGGMINNLNGLNVLNSIGGTFLIHHNANLPNLSGLENLISIGGDLIINNNNSLIYLIGLEGLISIGGNLYIWDNALINLAGLEGLISIGGDFGIGPSTLISLTGLEGLTSIGGNFEIEGADSLTSLTGLEELTSIGGDIEIYGNASLSDLDGLQGINDILGSLAISQNDNLESLSGLYNLLSVEGDIFIFDNASLVDLYGLNNLSSIGGILQIGLRGWEGACFGNPSLTDLTALDNLTSIEGGLIIICNESLSTLVGLDNIYANSIDFIGISFNSSLSTCAVQSVCEYLAIPGADYTIEHNASGCNSPEEVQDSCEANAVSVVERYILEECHVSPNSFTISTTLSFTLSKPENIHFTVYNLQSQIVYTIEEWRERGEQQLQWNAEGLPAGIYYFRIQAGDKVGGGKMVKME